MACFNCFRGRKTQGLESPEPVRRVLVQDNGEKTATVPQKISAEHRVVEEENATKDIGSKSHLELDKDITTAEPQTTRPEEPGPKTTEDSVATPRARTPILHPIRTSSNSSSLHSKPNPSSSSTAGSSLHHVSTKATTPPRSPLDAKTPSIPAVCAPPSQAQADTPARGTGCSSSPSGIEEKEQLPFPVIPSPPPAQPESEVRLDLKALEAYAPITTIADAKLNVPLLDTQCLPTTTFGPLHRRPSYEDDTPVTAAAGPLGQLHSGDFTPNDNATASSTLCQDHSDNEQRSNSPSTAGVRIERQTSRLGRLLSIGQRGRKQQKQQKEREKGGRVVVGVDNKEVEMLSEVAEVAEVIPREDEVRGMEEREGSLEKKLEGRKWKEEGEGDNDSLFCY